LVSGDEEVWNPVFGGRKLRALAATLAVTLGLAAFSAADSFGRFGYSVLANVPNWKIDGAGFRVVADGAAKFQFPAASKTFDAIATNANFQTVKMDDAPLCPTAARYSLIGESLDLKYKKGFSLKLDAPSSPFLSWKEGSVGPKIATPQLKWVLLSFSNAQPPIILGFSGTPATVRIDGGPGAWTLSSPDFTGWLRLLLPLGTRALAASDALTLGKLAQMMQTDDAVWSAKTPSVQSVKVTGDDQAVDADWTFDGPGAFLPAAATLAQIGGYPLTITSPHHQLQGDDALGPRQVVDGTHLTIHFPCRRISEGRAVGVGAFPNPLLGSASPSDVPSVVELAFESMLAVRDASLSKLADDTSSRYLTDVPYAVEPMTRQQLPYAADGTGLELAAAHALLAQATRLAVGSTEGNAMLDSIVCRRDWLTWQIWTTDERRMTTANILGAIAGSLSQTPSLRLFGATLEGGIEAQRGLQIWKQRNGYIESVARVNEPLYGLRSGIFALAGAPETDQAFFDLLESPVRIGVGSEVTATQSGEDCILQWSCSDSSNSVLTLLENRELRFDHPNNLSKIVSSFSDHLQTLTYVPISVGMCGATLEWPPGWAKLPAEVAPPPFVWKTG